MPDMHTCEHACESMRENLEPDKVKRDRLFTCATRTPTHLRVCASSAIPWHTNHVPWHTNHAFHGARTHTVDFFWMQTVCCFVTQQGRLVANTLSNRKSQRERHTSTHSREVEVFPCRVVSRAARGAQIDWRCAFLGGLP